MSRSYRKSPCGGLTNAASDKPFKEESSRRLRHNVNQAVHEIVKNPDLAEEIVLKEKGKELTNPYDAPKDGKVWLTKSYRRDEEKWSEWYERLMRK